MMIIIPTQFLPYRKHGFFVTTQIGWCFFVNYAFCVLTITQNARIRCQKIQINHQPDATIFQFIILTFIYSTTTCFGPAGPTTNTARLSPRHEGKTRGCHCSHWAPDDGRVNTQTCWAVNKRQDNKMKNYSIRLVIYLNCTMMHGLTNLKFYI